MSNVIDYKLEKDRRDGHLTVPDLVEQLLEHQDEIEVLAISFRLKGEDKEVDTAWTVADSTLEVVGLYEVGKTKALGKIFVPDED